MTTQKEVDAVYDWLYEDGKVPASIQPETRLFDVIIKATEGESPAGIVDLIEDARSIISTTKVNPAVVERFKNYFIARIVRENRLRQVVFDED